MNIYLIRDGGDERLWKAETMAEALKLAEDAYIAENGLSAVVSGVLIVGGEEGEDEERRRYRARLVESCTLIGELANP